MNKMLDCITVNTSDGHVFEMSISMVECDHSTPIILTIPAMGVPSKYYIPFLKKLNTLGLIACCGELRGTCTSSLNPKNTDFGYLEIIEHDIPALIDKIRNIFPNNPIFLLGHSLGGQLSLLYSSIDKSHLSGVVVIASGSVYFKSYQFPMRYFVFMGTQLATLISTFLGYFPGDKLKFGGLQPKGIINDWAYQSRTGNYKISNSSTDFESKLCRLETDILTVSIEDDQLAPLGAVEHLFDKLKTAKITHKRFELSQIYSRKKNTHFNWVKDSEGISILIFEWIYTKVLRK